VIRNAKLRVADGAESLKFGGSNLSDYLSSNETRAVNRSVAAQSEHGIDMRCSARGQIGGKQGYEQEQRSDSKEGDRVE
jgi:hypothetical protein